MNIESTAPQGKLKKILKILIIGEAGTGKTSLVRQYVKGDFSEFYKLTIGVDFASKDIEYSDNLSINLQLWDIAGQDHNDKMLRVYYQEACSALIVFDLQRPFTFDKVAAWKKDIDEKVLTSKNNPIPCLLIGNKIDLIINGEWYKTKEEIDQYVQENGYVGFFETSARNGTNIEKAILSIVKYVVDNNIEPYIENVQKPVPNEKEKKNSCCH